MASTAPALPIFYNGLEPLSSETHRDWRIRQRETAPFLVGQHAVPVTVEEFPSVGRHFPIIFSTGDEPIPLALFGLNEGVNAYVGDDGRLTEAVYVPAYVRRYPFMLARLRPDAQELSLCFDPTSDVVGAFDEGDPLFDGAEARAATKEILKFNDMFEQAGQRTANFVRELKEYGLLMEGETTITEDGGDRPFVYRGFQMVNEEKLTSLRGDQLRKMAQSGMLPLVYAHLMSMQLMREVFGRQKAQGKVPLPELTF